MSEAPPNALNTDTNRAVLAHLADKSAHSDVAEVLRTAVKPLGDVQLFCPDWQSYRYVAASTKDVIFTFAIGMNTLAFRLDATMRARALENGASPHAECGPDWVAFTLFQSDWPATDTGFWALKAYVSAREASRP